jgi:hypothetical protein
VGFRSEGGAGQGQVVMVRRVSRCVVTASVTRSSSSSGAGGWRGGKQGSQKNKSRQFRAQPLRSVPPSRWSALGSLHKYRVTF